MKNFILIILSVFLSGCMIKRAAEDLSILSKNVNSVITNEVKTSLIRVSDVSKSANDLLTNEVKTLLSDAHIFISEDLKLVVTDMHSIAGTSITILSNLNVQSEYMFSNVNVRTDATLDKVDKVLEVTSKTGENINKLVISANKLITRLNERSEDLSYSLPKWAERIRVILELLLGLLAVYAFRKNKIDEDVHKIYKKSKMKLSNFFNK
jgi:hypothetical protein